MNLKQRIRMNDLDPRDPDHDTLEELQEHWTQQYMDEYAEHGTIAGEDASDLELDTQLEKLKKLALTHLVSNGATPSQTAEAWRLYSVRLYELIYEAADETVSENWEEIKRDALEQHDEV